MIVLRERTALSHTLRKPGRIDRLEVFRADGCFLLEELADVVLVNDFFDVGVF
jgi:hypothetical protein